MRPMLNPNAYPYVFTVLLSLILLQQRSFSQSVGISNSSITPDASSILELRSSSKGMLLPRMTTTERDNITSPATGLMIYNTTTGKFNYYNGSSWVVFFAGTAGVNSITGTSNRITIGGTSADPTVDISSSYAGQNTITTLGTIGTGTWNGSTIGLAYGGTGATTQQDAINALTGTQTSGFYLRSNGTNAILSAIQAGDVPTLNQNTTGSAATLTTARNIYGNSFNGSADVTGIIASNFGGTGNGFTKFSGPTTAEKTFTLPNASATILTDNAAVTAAQGGTGQSSYTTGDLLFASSSTALSKLSAVAAGSFLRSAGTSTAPVWSTTTWPNSATTGDLLIASGSNTYGNLTGVATGNALISGGVGTAPSWGKIGLTTHVSGILGSANGGTGNGFTKFSGPTTAEKTFTLPDASATILTDNAAVTAAQGGTGQTSYTTGDLLFASSSTALSKLSAVAAGSFLRSAGTSTAPVWSTTTWPNSATTGDLLFASGNNTYANLTGVATGNALISGGVGTAPSWGKIALTTHVSGTLPIANGGTNSTATPTDGGIVYGDGTSYQLTAAGTTGQVLKSNGTAAPAWADGVTIVTLGSDVVNNNATANTIADVTGLSFSVSANVTYRFKAVIYYTSAATTTGSRWAINGPASPTLLAYTSQYSLTATTVTINNAAAYDIPAASNGTSTSTTGNIATIEGIIRPSASGTVIVRFASEVSGSAITAKAGSTLTWW